MRKEIKTAHFFRQTKEIWYSFGDGIGCEEVHQGEFNVDERHIEKYYLQDGENTDIRLIVYPTGTKWDHGFDAMDQSSPWYSEAEANW